MLEHELMTLISKELSKYGACFRANVGRVKTHDGRYFNTGLPKGFSDLFFVKDGQVTFLEVKSKTGKASESQEAFLYAMSEIYGCKAGIVRSLGDALKLCGLV